MRADPVFLQKKSMLPSSETELLFSTNILCVMAPHLADYYQTDLDG